MAESMIYVGPKYSSINNKEYCLLFQKQNEQQINTFRHTHKHKPSKSGSFRLSLTMGNF